MAGASFKFFREEKLIFSNLPREKKLIFSEVKCVHEKI